MEIIVFGVISGSIILFGALGFSMTLKAEGFINVAHGQMLLLGAYLALLFADLGLGMVFATLFVMVCCGVIGVLIFRYLYQPVKKRGILVLLFTSVGVAYVINGIVGAIAGTRVMAYDLPPVRAMRIGDVPLMTIYEAMIIAFALLAALLIHLFLTWTWIGKSIRAVADNYDLARVRGFDPVRTSDYVWFIASALAGLAGVFLGIIGSLHLGMGWQQIIIILAATVLGGLGSIYGVMLASMLLGIGMELGITVLPANYRTAVAFLIIIAVLFLRPEGLQSLWSPRSGARI
jgi:neutral amino acid transport system permease protein